ncbi:MAG: bifunctional 3-(3-hydroxy-phenyl)propionate/3-hydroxycinnamic acid hydroxylase [Chloroflexi bacterium]|nr:bifunctional 3-(3-hydroxy-phenyl)propionate/3-hydroxycinnamic acid hydroxylase [Chloroflexota bacterium]
MSEWDVLVVGAGPTGLTVANVLGQAGVSVLVVERNPTTTDEPKAVSIDEESLRLLQSIDLYEDMLRVLLPGTGTRYFGIGGALLGAARGPAPPRYGHPIKSELDQPEFERALAAGLERFPNVSLRFETEVAELSHDAEAVRVTFTTGETVTAAYVVGCDGGRSTVRKLMGVRMLGSSAQEPWIVLDTRNDPHNVRFAMHHGDPRRPHVIIPGRDGRCRYEFLLLPGEAPDAMLSLHSLRQLLAPYRHLEPDDIVRVKVYTFHALVAERWRDDRVFIAGDAAHMMPPFAGQGLNSGLRDAHNLSWKLAQVLDGVAGPGLLDTYQLERRAHAEAMIQMSVKLGKIVMTRSQSRAVVRDAFFRSVGQWGPIRRYVDEMRYKPAPRYRAGLLIGNDPELAGKMLPQPKVLLLDGRAHLLDDALGHGWAVLALSDGKRDPFATLGDPVWADIGARRLAIHACEHWPRPQPGVTAAVDAEDVLVRDLWPHGNRFILVRPDRYVAGAFTPGQESAIALELRRQLDSTHQSSPHQAAAQQVAESVAT